MNLLVITALALCCLLGLLFGFASGAAFSSWDQARQQRRLDFDHTIGPSAWERGSTTADHSA